MRSLSLPQNLHSLAAELQQAEDQLRQQRQKQKHATTRYNTPKTLKNTGDPSLQGPSPSSPPSPSFSLSPSTYNVDHDFVVANTDQICNLLETSITHGPLLTKLSQQRSKSTVDLVLSGHDRLNDEKHRSLHLQLSEHRLYTSPSSNLHAQLVNAANLRLDERKSNDDDDEENSSFFVSLDEDDEDESFHVTGSSHSEEAKPYAGFNHYQQQQLLAEPCESHDRSRSETDKLKSLLEHEACEMGSSEMLSDGDFQRADDGGRDINHTILDVVKDSPNTLGLNDGNQVCAMRSAAHVQTMVAELVGIFGISANMDPLLINSASLFNKPKNEDWESRSTISSSPRSVAIASEYGIASHPPPDVRNRSCDISAPPSQLNDRLIFRTTGKIPQSKASVLSDIDHVAQSFSPSLLTSHNRLHSLASSPFRGQRANLSQSLRLPRKGSLKQISTIGNQSSFGNNSCGSMSSLKRNVSFHQLEIREYSVALSDHPSCSYGPPVQLGWDYRDRAAIPVETYEAHRPPRRATHEMILSYNLRRYLLLQRAGYTTTEIRAAMREVERVKRERLVTDLLLPASMLDETLEEMRDRVKQMFGRSQQDTVCNLQQ
jgi:hypothetical protein